MKKGKTGTDELREEYSRADFQKLERGKYVAKLKASSNVVVIDPEIADLFPNAEAVNSALRSLAEIARRSGERDARSP